MCANCERLERENFLLKEQIKQTAGMLRPHDYEAPAPSKEPQWFRDFYRLDDTD